MFDLLTFVLLVACAMGLGRAALSALGVTMDRWSEAAPVWCAAGFGTLAAVLGAFALGGALGWADWLVPAGAVATVAWMTVSVRRRCVPRVCLTLGRPSILSAAIALMLAGACLGAIAPVTESDSLAYPLPVAMRLSAGAAWRFWPDMARSVYPLSQELLAAWLLRMGNARVGLLSATELVVSALLIVALSRRMTPAANAGTTSRIAVLMALGCPAVAFLAGSIKEDLLLVALTLAAALMLSLPPALGCAAAAGLFAGFAAGAKYTGIPVAIAVVACVPFCCGRDRRVMSVIAAAGTAIVAGGLWYGVNAARFGNPLPPLLPSIGHFPISATAARDWLQGFGEGRSFFDALLAPLRMTRDVVTFSAGEFGGRGNWINPLIWLGVPGLLVSRRERALVPIVVIGLALYVTWFMGFQVARLLLPAAALLSIPAADLVGRLWNPGPAHRRVSLARYPLGAALLLSAAIVAAIGGVRWVRYVRNPQGFIASETEHFETIEWMNTHLDPARDRVVTWERSPGYLRVPWMNLGTDYQVEISEADGADAGRLRAALKRQGFTHVFGAPERFASIAEHLHLVYENPVSRLGGDSFFRDPPTGRVAVFEIK